ncbi:MAG: hypothetical protein ACRDOI_19985 [Trebonia sp.]
MTATTLAAAAYRASVARAPAPVLDAHQLHLAYLARLAALGQTASTAPVKKPATARPAPEAVNPAACQSNIEGCLQAAGLVTAGGTIAGPRDAAAYNTAEAKAETATRQAQATAVRKAASGAAPYTRQFGSAHTAVTAASETAYQQAQQSALAAFQHHYGRVPDLAGCTAGPYGGIPACGVGGVVEEGVFLHDYLCTEHGVTCSGPGAGNPFGNAAALAAAVGMGLPGGSGARGQSEAGEGGAVADEVGGSTDDLPGESESYIDRTTGGSTRNIGTSTTHTEFGDALTGNGWSVRTSQDGTVQIFTKDGAKYILREKAGSYDGWSADFTPVGSSRVTLKIRLGVSG